jgi:2-polyprenyl-3-methyl-5-hydroxy-6-metoxy-1,4-benzoquinol methylase
MPEYYKMNRYSGPYALKGKSGTAATPKLKCSCVTQINLWEIVDRNKIYTSFETIEGRSTTRQARQEYCYRRFRKYFGDKVLDVGCDDGVIRSLHDGLYVGIDKYGKPDVLVDLEQGFLPFADSSFDTVVCLEVLEHVDSLHRLFSELVRGSCNIIIVTLPNCWRQVFGEIVLGRSSKAEYGLPPERPQDRHKWLFNTQEAERFVAWQAEKYGLEILEIEYVRNIGDLFSFSWRFGRKHSFHYPPHEHWREMSILTRFVVFNITLLEKLVKLLFLMIGRRGRNINVVNMWFVMQIATKDNRRQQA